MVDPRYERSLVVCAVEAERDAVVAGLSGTAGSRRAKLLGSPANVAVVGVGPAAAAAGTARLLAIAEAAGKPYELVLSAGIAGGFADRVPVGGLVLATSSIAADLGVETPAGFQPLDQLGFGDTRCLVRPDLISYLSGLLPDAVCGDILTVSTATGSASRAGQLRLAHPGAVAEGMEGYGVATAVFQAEGALAFAELRTISNPIGPRDRASWRIPEALAALTTAFRRLRHT